MLPGAGGCVGDCPGSVPCLVPAATHICCLQTRGPLGPACVASRPRRSPRAPGRLPSLLAAGAGGPRPGCRSPLCLTAAAVDLASPAGPAGALPPAPPRPFLWPLPSPAVPAGTPLPAGTGLCHLPVVAAPRGRAGQGSHRLLGRTRLCFSPSVPYSHVRSSASGVRPRHQPFSLPFPNLHLSSAFWEVPMSPHVAVNVTHLIPKRP